MQFSSGKSRASQEALILPFWQGKRPEPAFSEKTLLVQVSPVLQSGDFTGKAEEVLCFYPPKGKEKRLILVGLGEKKALTHERVRRSYAHATRLLLSKKAKGVSVLIPEMDVLNRKELLTALIEGILLSNYAFDHKSEKQPACLEKIHFLNALSSDLQLCKKLVAVSSSVHFTRDLVFGNADEVTPSHLAKQAQELSKHYSRLQTKVLNHAQIEKEKLGLLLAVNRASSPEAALIVVQYKGDPQSSDLTGLVGKGITFDTGGLLIKSRGGMETMRDDMAGAAVVLGTLRAAAELKLKVNLVAIIPTTENAIGPKSYKPGDVYKSHAGISVEIADTDAEGRLVLADALSYLQTHFSPKRIIDLATLTGGAIVALGEEAAAICSNDDELTAQLIEAGQSTYERLWRLPLFEEYQDLLKSKIADIKNSGPRKASTICGGIFLQRFIKKIPWAHLDIAGVAFPDTQKPYQPVQATGFGVRLLISFLEKLHEHSS